MPETPMKKINEYSWVLQLVVIIVSLAIFFTDTNGVVNETKELAKANSKALMEIVYCLKDTNKDHRNFADTMKENSAAIRELSSATRMLNATMLSLKDDLKKNKSYPASYNGKM